jgi:hypothetical protein
VFRSIVSSEFIVIRTFFVDNRLVRNPNEPVDDRTVGVSLVEVRSDLRLRHFSLARLRSPQHGPPRFEQNDVTRTSHQRNTTPGRHELLTG